MAKSNTILPDEPMPVEEPKRLDKTVKMLTKSPPARKLTFDEYIRFKSLTDMQIAGFKAWAKVAPGMYNTREGWDMLFKTYTTRRLGD